MKQMTTIQISREMKEKLDKLKLSRRETYNDVIEQLIEDSQELSEQAIVDLNEALEDVKNGRVTPHDEVKRRLTL
ncbi:MAG: DUF7557 family protein [Promethearchaeota archaeon]